MNPLTLNRDPITPEELTDIVAKNYRTFTGGLITRHATEVKFHAALNVHHYSQGPDPKTVVQELEKILVARIYANPRQQMAEAIDRIEMNVLQAAPGFHRALAELKKLTRYSQPEKS